MNTEPMPKCPQCGSTLPPNAPEGLCPNCLIAMNLKTETVLSGEPSVAPPTLPPDKIAPHFPQLEILECLGRGGMGVVYKARQKSLNRLVALKLLAPERVGDPAFAQRFTREAQALAALNHPNIVTIYDFGQAGGFYFLLMEFVDGANLRELLRARKFTPEEALAIVPPLCDALQFAHERGIVHRDIKPENILLDKSGRVKVADFGIAKMLGNGGGDDGGKASAPENATQSVVGTPAYSAPEQKTDPRRVDSRADIYSLGVVFYEMLTGELPGKPLEPPSHKVQIDVRLDEVVLRALEKKPDLRYQQASVLKTRIETIISESGNQAQSQGKSPAPPGGKNIQSGSAIIALPAVGLMIVAAWKFFIALMAMFAAAGAANSAWLSGLFENLGVGSVGPIKLIAIFSVVLFTVVPAALIFFGAYEMLRIRSYAWAIAAGIIAIISCSVIGLLFGIWSLIVLGRQDVRAAFSAKKTRVFPVVAAVLIFLMATSSLISLVAFSKDIAAHLAIPSSGPEITENFKTNCPLAANGTFSLDNVNGQTSITSWDGNEVVVNGVKHTHSRDDMDAFKVDVDSEADHLVIHTRQPSTPGFSGWFKINGLRDASIDYTVQVPRSTRLKNIVSVNGSITITGITNDIKASTVNGGMDVSGAQSDLNLSTVNGHISAELDALGHGQRVSFDAVNGKIEATLPADADAKVSANSVNGSLTSDFPELMVEKKFPVVSNLKGVLGNGSASVKATTVNGSVSFRRGPKTSVATTEQPPLVTTSGVSTLNYQWDYVSNPPSASSPATAQQVDPLPCVQKWLALVDDGDYGQSWETAGNSFREEVAKDDWIAKLNDVRLPLGNVLSRTLKSAQQVTNFPGMPDGVYYVAAFNTAFAKFQPAVESAVFSLEPDGQWKAAAYLISPGTQTAPAQLTAAENAAVEAAQSWLALVDNGDYSDSWLQAEPRFQSAVTEQGWSSTLENVRKPLGTVLFRKLISATSMTSLPGAPDGRYVIIQFNTSFANKQSSVETLTFIMVTNGAWKASGYFIK